MLVSTFLGGEKLPENSGKMKGFKIGIPESKELYDVILVVTVTGYPTNNARAWKMYRFPASKHGVMLGIYVKFQGPITNMLP